MGNAITGETKYAVIIEWGGQAPPNRWYDWLYKLATLHVREGKTTFVEADAQEADISVLAQRATEKGVIAQEGAIICASESLARTIANLAARGMAVKQRGGGSRLVKPREVLVGPFSPQPILATPQDEEALARIQIQFGRKGRKPAQAETFTVCCLEERRTYTIEGHTAVNCPACGATNVKIAHGQPPTWADPGGTVLEGWLRTRFASDEFMIPQEGGTLPAPPVSTVKTREAQAYIQNLIASPLMLQVMGIVDRGEAFQILDAAYTARVHMNGERRLRQRVETATVYLRAGGSPMGIQLGELPDRYDLLDASVLGPAYIAGLLLKGSEQPSNAAADIKVKV